MNFTIVVFLFYSVLNRITTLLHSEESAGEDEDDVRDGQHGEQLVEKTA